MNHSQGSLTVNAIKTVFRTVGEVLAFERRINREAAARFPDDRKLERYYFVRGARDSADRQMPRLYRDASFQGAYDDGYHWSTQQREQERAGGVR